MSNKENFLKKKSVASPPMEELVIGDATYQTRLNTKFRNRKTWSRPDENRVESVIPGNIKKIMVKEGTEVTQGTPLLILEAMKMENKVLSPIDGVIKKIYISEGEQVAKSQLLVEFS
ncbi:MAG: acetyl-CoA carboxylase biotin carboxyl carrier protein subunit [Bacteroidota bacterium]